MRGLLFILLVSGLLVLLGDAVVPQRQFDGPTGNLTIRGDTFKYTQMIDGEIDSVPIPFKHRVLVPIIGKLLPLSPTMALKVITYSTLFIAYVFALLACRKLGINPIASLFGLLALYTSVWHLYNYHNPFLVDAFQLMCLSVMFYALVTRNLLVFLAGAILGILARESTIFLVPCWLITSQWRNLAIVMILAGITWYLPRIIWPGDSSTSSYMIDILSSIDPVDKSREISKTLMKSWSAVGAVTLMGLIVAPVTRIWTLLFALVLLIIGAMISSLFASASDLGRMFELLFPVMIVSSAYLFSTLWKANPLITLALALALICRAFLSPIEILSIGFFESNYPLILIQLSLIAIVIYILRREFAHGITEKLGVFKISITSRSNILTSFTKN